MSEGIGHNGLEKNTKLLQIIVRFALDWPNASKHRGGALTTRTRGTRNHPPHTKHTLTVTNSTATLLLVCPRNSLDRKEANWRGGKAAHVPCLSIRALLKTRASRDPSLAEPPQTGGISTDKNLRTFALTPMSHWYLIALGAIVFSTTRRPSRAAGCNGHYECNRTKRTRVRGTKPDPSWQWQ